MRYPLPLHPRFDLLAVTCQISMIVLVTMSYSQLPEIIPIHFNSAGEADGFGSKYIIWLLPLLGGFMYLLLGYASSERLAKPSQGPWATMRPKKGMEQAVRKNTIEMLGFLRAAILFVFAYITWASIATAEGRMDGLGGSFTWIFFLGLFVPLAYYIWQGVKMSE